MDLITSDRNQTPAVRTVALFSQLHHPYNTEEYSNTCCKYDETDLLNEY